jgi:hypothetical protein
VVQRTWKVVTRVDDLPFASIVTRTLRSLPFAVFGITNASFAMPFLKWGIRFPQVVRWDRLG